MRLASERGSHADVVLNGLVGNMESMFSFNTHVDGMVGRLPCSVWEERLWGPGAYVHCGCGTV